MRLSEHYYGADATQTANFYTLGFSINHQTDEMVEAREPRAQPGGKNLATADQSRVREIRLIAQAWEQYSSGSRPTVH